MTIDTAPTSEADWCIRSDTAEEITPTITNAMDDFYAAIGVAKTPKGLAARLQRHGFGVVDLGDGNFGMWTKMSLAGLTYAADRLDNAGYITFADEDEDDYPWVDGETD
jgi:hypothetical protein